MSYLQLIIEDRELKIKEQEENEENDEDDDDDNDDDKENKRKQRKHKLKRRYLKTLVIVPASLLHHWMNEIENHFEKNSFKCHTYHDANRKKHSYNLQENDIVFTTYEIVTRELDFDENMSMKKNESPLAKIKWKRVILDEAHRIKNHTTKSSKNISAIKSKYRLAVTGTL